MQPAYDADDFFSRGFLGSIIGFGSRKRASSKTDTSTTTKPVKEPAAPLTTQPTVPQSVVAENPVETRTEADIYREIVSEAELWEQSQPTTPDFSCPTSPLPPRLIPHPQQYFIPPQPVYIPPGSMMHHDAQKIYPPYHMVMTPVAPHPIPVDQNGVPLGNQCPMAPPPYFQQPQQLPQQPSGSAPQIPYEVKREIQEHLVNSGNPQVSIEEIVKLVVTALKDSNIEESGGKEESPEEILRRKRVQNNLAAARYRKRQREAKDSAELELGDLAKRNDELRSMVAKMEDEIAQLKQIVLNK
ncbi:unnamed protein product [Caenorhabditis angaria]|uniref:BZIP domain-containing protein n=1 Tax=Caenorhabditis angaria TaxID=860376 RepID=A0A9P1IDU4_9PELO|nr:unnamed protein product [Caenorhabditis angaria]